MPQKIVKNQDMNRYIALPFSPNFEEVSTLELLSVRKKGEELSEKSKQKPD